jgi:CheY-like chemotaxis protein
MFHRIPHVEDNSEDSLLTKMAFRNALLTVHVDLAADGDSAVAIPAGCSNIPNCLLLDIRLPGKSRLEVLAWNRALPLTRSAP